MPIIVALVSVVVVVVEQLAVDGDDSNKRVGFYKLTRPLDQSNVVAFAWPTYESRAFVCISRC